MNDLLKDRAPNINELVRKLEACGYKFLRFENNCDDECLPVDVEWNYKDQPPELWNQYKNETEEKSHIRVHPLLHWTEVDIWYYIKREEIPITDLYFDQGDGKRFRSIGCEPCCGKIDSCASNIDDMIEELETTNTSERAGRAQDKEDATTMQKLRALGYM